MALGKNYTGKTRVVIDGDEIMATEIEVRFLQSQFLVAPDKEEFKRRVKIYNSPFDTVWTKEMELQDSGRFEESFPHHLFDAANIFCIDILKKERGLKTDHKFCLY